MRLGAELEQVGPGEHGGEQAVGHRPRADREARHVGGERLDLLARRQPVLLVLAQPRGNADAHGREAGADRGVDPRGLGSRAREQDTVGGDTGELGDESGRSGRGTCSSVSSESTVWNAPSWNGSGPAGAWIAVIDGATFAGNSTSSPTKGTSGCAQAKPCGPQPTSSRLPSGAPVGVEDRGPGGGVAGEPVQHASGLSGREGACGVHEAGDALDRVVVRACWPSAARARVRRRPRSRAAAQRGVRLERGVRVQRGVVHRAHLDPVAGRERRRSGRAFRASGTARGRSARSSARRRPGTAGWRPGRSRRAAGRRCPGGVATTSSIWSSMASAAAEWSSDSLAFIPMSVLIRVPGSRPKLIMRADAGREVGVGRGDQAALADAERLRGVEREDLGVAEAAERPRRRRRGCRSRARSRSAAARRGRRTAHARRRAARPAGAVPKVAHASTPAIRPPKRSKAASRATGSMCQPRRSMSTNDGLEAGPLDRARGGGEGVGGGDDQAPLAGGHAAGGAQGDHQADGAVADRDRERAAADVVRQAVGQQPGVGAAVGVEARLGGSARSRP